jgi:hypothetical protein
MNPTSYKKPQSETYSGNMACGNHVFLENLKNNRINGKFYITRKQLNACYKNINKDEAFDLLWKNACVTKIEREDKNQTRKFTCCLKEDKWYDDLCVVSRIFFGMLDRLKK